MVKTRFGSLKGIRTQIKTKADFSAVNKHIIVCLILHNLLIKFDDEWEHSDEEQEEVEDDRLDQNLMVNTGHELRIKVQNELLEWYFLNGGRMRQ